MDSYTKEFCDFIKSQKYKELQEYIENYRKTHNNSNSDFVILFQGNFSSFITNVDLTTKFLDYFGDLISEDMRRDMFVLNDGIAMIFRVLHTIEHYILLTVILDKIKMTHILKKKLLDMEELSKDFYLSR